MTTPAALCRVCGRRREDGRHLTKVEEAVAILVKHLERGLHLLALVRLTLVHLSTEQVEEFVKIDFAITAANSHTQHRCTLGQLL